LYVPNQIITNCDSGSVVVELGGTQDGILESGEVVETVIRAGTILAQEVGGNFALFADGVAGPLFVLTYDVTVPASGTCGITALSAGKVNQNRLIVHDVDPPVPLTPVILSALRDHSIIPVDVVQLGAPFEEV
jgi:hypothetical protein